MRWRKTKRKRGRVENGPRAGRSRRMANRSGQVAAPTLAHPGHMTSMIPLTSLTSHLSHRALRVWNQITPRQPGCLSACCTCRRSGTPALRAAGYCLLATDWHTSWIHPGSLPSSGSSRSASAMLTLHPFPTPATPCALRLLRNWPQRTSAAPYSESSCWNRHASRPPRPLSAALSPNADPPPCHPAIGSTRCPHGPDLSVESLQFNPIMHFSSVSPAILQSAPLFPCSAYWFTFD